MQNPSITREWPDTLDLAARATLAFNAMQGVADDDYEGIPFFSGFLQSDAQHPAWMSHGNWDFGSSHGRLVDAIALVREMTGISGGAEIEERYQRNLLSFVQEDGFRCSQDQATAAQRAIAPGRAAYSIHCASRPSCETAGHTGSSS